MMKKEDLLDELIFQIEGHFASETPPIVPSEEKITWCKEQCEIFAREFPSYTPGYYIPTEPAGADLMARTRFWYKNLVFLMSQTIIHKDLPEKVDATPELAPFAELMRYTLQTRKSNRGEDN